MRLKHLILLSAVLVGTASTASAQQWSGVLSASRGADWATAGAGPIPLRTTMCATFNPGATAAQINAAIAACPANQVVYLNPGTYTLSGGIVFNDKNGVTLRGAGANQTFLIFTANHSCGGVGGDICFMNGAPVYYGQPGNTANWTGGLAQGSTTVTLSNTTNLKVGTQLVLDQLADDYTVSGASWSGGIATLTIGAHSPITGGMVGVVNVSPSGYNSPFVGHAYPIVSETSTTISYALATNPGGYSGGGVAYVDDGTVAQINKQFTCLNCNNAGRSGRTNNQLVTVTGISGNSVTISPAVFLPNWRADRSPGAWWSSDTPISASGVENLSIDSGLVRQGGGIVAFFNAAGCWMRGVRTMNAYDAHVKFWVGSHNTIRDSYFFANQNSVSQSYGTDGYMSASNLIENNVFHHVTVPNMNEGTHGEVFAYNYSINNFYGQGNIESGIALHSGYTHAVGTNYTLWEGNDYDGIALENFHGPAQFITAFRNRLGGKEQSKTERTSPIFNQSFSRFTNVIGNVLGLAGYHTNYINKFGDTVNQSLCERSIYALGWGGNCQNWTVPQDCSGYVACPIPDSKVDTTMMRWGNYDVVTAANRFNASEVPSGLSRYGNSVPSGTALPASFYLSAKPAFFPAATPWPAIGPDVSGGTLPNVAGHAYRIPARACFEDVMLGLFTDTTARSFNAAACYPSSGGGSTAPAAPTNLRIIR